MSHDLACRLRDEIRDVGPITFARFMDVSLADTSLGYYMQPAARPTREGDFLTAPEMHPIFGRTLARQVDDCWRLLGRPDPFTLREYGAGSGALIGAILDGLRADGSGLLAAGAGGAAGAAGAGGGVPIRVEPVEVNPHRRRELEARVAATAPEVQVADPVPGVPIVGVVLANEFVDALPVHRVAARGGRLREILVGWEESLAGAGPSAALGGRFVDVLAEPSTPAIAARLAADGVQLADGQVAEVRLEDEAWLDEVARDLRRGHVLVVDYGASAVQLYDAARRPAGTLLAYRGHEVLDDPYADPGDQDLTAHVDITALEDGAHLRGLAPIGRTTQARFLVACGLAELVEGVRSDPATTFESYLAMRSAVARLLDPRATGGFFVLALGRDLPAGAQRLRGLVGAAGAGAA